MKKLKVLLLCGVMSISSLTMGATPTVKELIESGRVNPWNIEQVKQQSKTEQLNDYLNDSKLLNDADFKGISELASLILNDFSKLTADNIKSLKNNQEISKNIAIIGTFRDVKIESMKFKTEKGKAVAISYQQMCNNLIDCMSAIYNGDKVLFDAFSKQVQTQSVSCYNANYFFLKYGENLTGELMTNEAQFKQVNGIK